jgi:hypothetical protein
MIVMEELFQVMMKSLSNAADSIKEEISKTTKWIPLNPGINWDEYGDALMLLNSRLVQLNALLNVEYSFDEGLPHDVINFTKQLQDVEAPCEELVGYLLSRDQVFPNDRFIRDETDHLKEILNDIIKSSNRIVQSLSAGG